MASIILGIMGKKRSGKDAFASRLVEHHGFTRLAFADPLKEIALSMNPILGYDANYLRDLTLRDAVESYGWDGAKEIGQVRRYLQHLGEQVRQHLGEQVWINALADKASRVPGPVVVTDVRRKNEARWVQSYGDLVNIIRPGTDDGDKDVSETDLDAWVSNHVIINCTTIERLWRNADAVVEYLEEMGARSA